MQCKFNKLTKKKKKSPLIIFHDFAKKKETFCENGPLNRIYIDQFEIIQFLLELIFIKCYPVTTLSNIF